MASTRQYYKLKNHLNQFFLNENPNCSLCEEGYIVLDESTYLLHGCGVRVENGDKYLGGVGIGRTNRSILDADIFIVEINWRN